MNIEVLNCIFGDLPQEFKSKITTNKTKEFYKITDGGLYVELLVRSNLYQERDNINNPIMKEVFKILSSNDILTEENDLIIYSNDYLLYHNVRKMLYILRKINYTIESFQKNDENSTIIQFISTVINEVKECRRENQE